MHPYEQIQQYASLFKHCENVQPVLLIIVNCICELERQNNHEKSLALIDLCNAAVHQKCLIDSVFKSKLFALLKEIYYEDYLQSIKITNVHSPLGL